MITFIRWYMMKAKEIKVKLSLYRCLEKGMNYIAENSGDLKKLFVHELAEAIHNAPGREE